MQFRSRFRPGALVATLKRSSGFPGGGVDADGTPKSSSFWILSLSPGAEPIARSRYVLLGQIGGDVDVDLRLKESIEQH